MRSKLSVAVAVAVAMAITASVSVETAAQLALEEVVVTAQKREQSAQDVPIAVTAMSADQLQAQNIDTIVDVQRANPSFSVRPGYNRASQTPVSIRGIGTSGVSAAFEGSVGFYVDGVYRSRPGMVLSTFNDIGGLEILRGPQGTLFGKNTTAGAMILNSTEPAHEFGYGGEITAGNYGKKRYQAYVTGGLSDTVAARFSAMKDERDGFYEDRFDSSENEGNVDVEAYKLQLLFEPTDDLSIKLIADYADSSENCCFGMSSLLDREDTRGGLDFLPTAFYEGLSLDNIPAGADPTVDPDDFYEREYHLNSRSINENTDQGVVVDVNYDLSSFSIRSITGVRNWEYTSSGDFDFGPVDLGENLTEDYEVDSFSQEFNITGQWDDLFNGTEYVFGLFYANEELDLRRFFSEGTDAPINWQTVWTPVLSGIPLDPADPANFGQDNLLDLFALAYGGGDVSAIGWAAPGVVVQDNEFTLEDEMMAAFAHFTVSFTDKLSAVIGVRYSEEEKTVDRTNLLSNDHSAYSDFFLQNAFGFSLLGVNSSGPDLQASVDEEEWTYNIALQYFLNDTTQLYGGYARGYKAGGIDLLPDTGGQSVAILSPTGTGLSPALPTTYSPEYVDSYELGLKSDLLDGRARLNIAAFRMEFEDIQFSLFSGTGFLIDNAGTATSQGLEVEGSYVLTESLTTDLSLTFLDAQYGSDIPAPGRPNEDLNHAPDYAATFTLRYDQEVTNALAVFSNFSYSYRDSHSLVYGADAEEDGYDLVSFQMGLRDSSDRWSVTLWCDNCFDEEYVTFTYSQPFYFDNSNPGYPGEPMTYGLTLRASM